MHVLISLLVVAVALFLGLWLATWAGLYHLGFLKEVSFGVQAITSVLILVAIVGPGLFYALMFFVGFLLDELGIRGRKTRSIG